MTLFSVEGKTAVVTGGSRGIGRMIAAGFTAAGAKVIISARKAAEVEKTAAELGCTAVVADLSTPEGVDALVSAVQEPLHVLVNNAGATWGAPAEEHPPEAWHKVMKLNVDTVFFLSQEVGRRCMIPRKSGKIINIASIAGLSGNPPGMNTIAYNTSKGAVINFTRTLAAEWGKYNINVNAICPGFFPSKMTHGILSEMGDMFIGRTPLQRLGGEEDLMGVVALFASDASRHITGQWLAVDGGSTVA